MTDFIARNAEWYPEKTAIVCEGIRLSWGEFGQRINRIANQLIKAGIAKGEKVVILSQNRLEYPEIMFGALKAGTVLVPVSTMLQKDAVLLQLKDAAPAVIFAESESAKLLAADRLPEIRIVLDGEAEGWTDYRDVLQAGSAEDPGTVLAPDDWYNIIYSSGTTGTPKGIVHTHQGRMLFALSCGLEFRVHNEAVGLVSTPLYSNGTQLIFLPTVLMCGTLVLMRTFDAAAFLDLVQRERVTHAFLVPTQFIRIMEHPQFADYDTSSIEILLSAAAPLRKETKREILQKFPSSKLTELYGITEGISTVLRPDEQLSKLGSVGKPRLGGDIKIIDPEGRELPRGGIGEIVGTSFSMMAEYYRNPAGTQESVWEDRGGRAFIRTGDIGRLDAEGYLYILDRKKDLIISGGLNIFPSDIESILVRHPEVREAAVIGIPHREWGESPLALVVKNQPDSTLSETDLRDWANRQLAAYQRLAAVEFRSSLPRNDLGKVLKNELRKSFIKFP